MNNMGNDFLNLHYYFDSDGNKESIVNALADCFKQCAYLTMKNKFKLDIDNYYEIFLMDTVFCYCTDYNDILVDWSLLNCNYNDGLFNVLLCDKSNLEAVYEIERLLDCNEIVLAQTVNQMLPHSTLYDPKYDIANFKPGHLFLIIGHDDEYFYFVENPDMINTSKFTRHPLNNEVGLLKKDFLKDLAQFFLKCRTITLNNQALLNCKNNAHLILKDSIANFYRTATNDGSLKYTYGEEAFKSLIKGFKNESFNLSHMAPSKDRELYAYFDWKIWCIKNSRKIFKNYLLTDDVYNKKTKTAELVEKIDNSINLWELIFRLMTKKYMGKNFIVGKDFVKHFEKISIIEKEIINSCSSIIAG